VKNIPPHAQAALKAQTSHPEKVPKKGQWVEYVITINGAELSRFTQSPLNRIHYIEKQLQPIAESILPYLNSSFEQIINGQKSLF
jgi:DNA polymerase-2